MHRKCGTPANIKSTIRCVDFLVFPSCSGRLESQFGHTVGSGMTAQSRRLIDKVAIVTGGSQGIGAEYARALASEGAAVVIGDPIDAGDVVRSIEQAGGRALHAIADVTDAASVDLMVKSAVESFGRIDILVNNAAIFSSLAMKPFDEIDTVEWDRVMAVNVRGTFECIKAVVPYMISEQLRKDREYCVRNCVQGRTISSPLCHVEGRDTRNDTEPCARTQAIRESASTRSHPG